MLYVIDADDVVTAAGVPPGNVHDQDVGELVDKSMNETEVP